jgi:hypothetical protein
MIEIKREAKKERMRDSQKKKQRDKGRKTERDIARKKECRDKYRQADRQIGSNR